MARQAHSSNSMTRLLKLPEARAFLQEQIDRCGDQIAQFLAPFEPNSTFEGWLQTFRAIEEFINIPLCELNDELLEQRFVRCRLDSLSPDVESIKVISDVLACRFSPEVAKRYTLTIVQASSAGLAWRSVDRHDVAAGFETIGTAIGYFQSRRRHILALLHTIPSACKGERVVTRLDTLNVFLPVLEGFAIPLTGLYHQLMLSHVFPEYALFISDHGFKSTHEQQVLDKLFREPERMGLDEAIREAGDHDALSTLEQKDPRNVFSTAETRNNIRLQQLAFERFGLSRTEFPAVAGVVEALLECVDDQYFVRVPAERFDRLLENANLRRATIAALVNVAHDFADNTNAIAPFIRNGCNYVSTLPLLDRFLYQWRSICLERTRPFQIHAGFMFERKIKEELAAQGFEIADIKRINRKEFDVVATLRGVIYNIQCKNNMIDYSQVERFPERIARHNRQLDRYYAKALQKEQSREGLLFAKLGLKQVRHVIVSRYPIATTNENVISLAEIARFKERFANGANEPRATTSG